MGSGTNQKINKILRTFLQFFGIKVGVFLIKVEYLVGEILFFDPRSCLISILIEISQNGFWDEPKNK